MTQYGPNCSEVNDKLLVQQETAEVTDGASINLLEGDLKYTLEFLKDAVHISSKHKHHSKSSSPEKSHKRIKVLSDSLCTNETEPQEETSSSTICGNLESVTSNSEISSANKAEAEGILLKSTI